MHPSPSMTRLRGGLAASASSDALDQMELPVYTPSSKPGKPARRAGLALPPWLQACTEHRLVAKVIAIAAYPLSIRLIYVVIAAVVSFSLYARASKEERRYDREFHQLVSTLAALTGGIPVANGVLLNSRPEGDAATDPDIRWCTEPDFSAPFSSACTVPIVLYTWSRPDYLKRTLGRLRELNKQAMSQPGWPSNLAALRVILSLDGAHPDMVAALEEEVLTHGTQSPLTRIMFHPVASWHPEHRGDKGLMNLKRHWVWILTQVFDVLPELRSHSGPVLFMEEDMELSPDALYVFRWLAGLKAACEDCWGGALAVCGYSEANDAPPPWEAHVRPLFTNSAFFLDRPVWRRMSTPEALAHFWSFRDGWDWSMLHLIQRGVIPPRAVVPALSRLRNFGDVGITVSKSYYEKAGLGSSPVSAETVSSFFAAVEGGKLAAVSTPVGPGGAPEVWQNPLGQDVQGWVDLRERCGTCENAAEE